MSEGGSEPAGPVAKRVKTVDSRPFPFPVDEEMRLRELAMLEILDTPPEQYFDHIVHLACSMFQVPIGLVSLVDRDRQFFKACKGLDVTGTSRDVSFCAHAIAQREDIFVVPDATKDPRFAANSLVTGAPFIRFYAASSIVVGGHKIGTLCIISPKPREFLSDEAAQLTRLGWLVQTELRARVEQKAFKLISSSQNQMLLRAVNQSSEALVVLDQRADIMYANTAFSVCTGFDSDGVKGKSIDVVSGGASGSGVSSADNSFLSSRIRAESGAACGSGTILATHANGTPIWLRYTFSPIANDGASGGVQSSKPSGSSSSSAAVEAGRGWFLSFSDCTQMKRDEDDRAAGQLKEAEMVRAKGIFLANMSHEIRTPLHGIIGSIDLLDGTELSTEQSSFASNLSTSANLLLHIVNNVLDYTKLEEGKMAIRTAPCRVSAVLESVNRIFADAAVQKRVKLSKIIDEGCPECFQVDETRTVQILCNLVGNALKATPQEGTIAIRASVRSVRGELDFITGEPALSAGEPRLRITVSDTGHGVASVNMGELFVPFAQCSKNSSNHQQGTGLGLALCKKFGSLMGWDVGLEMNAAAAAAGGSAVAGGKKTTPGSTFFIDVPMSATSVLAPSNAQCEGGSALHFASSVLQQSVRSPAYTMQQNGGGTSCGNKGADSPSSSEPAPELNSCEVAVDAELVGPVLIVEDNEMSVKVMRNMMIQLGVKKSSIDIARNGLEAVKAVQLTGEACRTNGRPFYSVILMDIQMPLMDGYEATSLIRKYEKEQGPSLKGWSAKGCLQVRSSPVPIYACTANAFAEDDQACHNAGCTRVLHKPMKKAEVKSTLEKHVFQEPAPPTITQVASTPH